MQTVTNQQKLKPWMGFVLFAVLMAVFLFVCVPMQTATHEISAARRFHFTSVRAMNPPAQKLTAEHPAMRKRKRQSHHP